jgi:hypothetical protein
MPIAPRKEAIDRGAVLRQRIIKQEKNGGVLTTVKHKIARE